MRRRVLDATASLMGHAPTTVWACVLTLGVTVSANAEASEGFIFATDDGPPSAAAEAVELPGARVAEHVEGIDPRAILDPATESPGFISEPVEENQTEHEPAGADQLPRPELPEGPAAITFRGLMPGASTRDDVLSIWGEPASETEDGQRADFEMADFSAVRVLFAGDVVDSIVVALSEPLEASRLVEALGLDGVRPAEILDGTGLPVARVFPERGVLMRHDPNPSESDELLTEEPERIGEPGDVMISAIVIQPIKAESFLLRVHSTSRLNPSEIIADLDKALQFDRTSAHARWLLSQTLLETGKAVAAERLAAEAVELDSSNGTYRLQWAKCLRELARYDVAVNEVRTVLQSPSVEPIMRAAALYEMGRLAALGPADLAKRAVPLLDKSITLADKLTSDGSSQVRASAEKLLVDAHLEIAKSIAAGDWSEKTKSVEQWISRASALVEHMIDTEATNLDLRLDLTTEALAALRQLDSPVDPDPWVREAEETAEALGQLTSDEIALERVAWRLGMVYFYAAQIEYTRGFAEQALHLGALAEEKLVAVASARDELPDTAYVLGELYFHMGAVHAVHFEDHTAACRWYDRAAELLLNPVPVTTVATPSRHGEALVSMGVSYWNAGQKRRATELTEAGLLLVERAVDGGMLTNDALSVPYSNLSAMYNAQGRKMPAQFVELASRTAPQAKPDTVQR